MSWVSNLSKGAHLAKPTIGPACQSGGSGSDMCNAVLGSARGNVEQTMYQTVDFDPVQSQPTLEQLHHGVVAI